MESNTGKFRFMTDIRNTPPPFPQGEPRFVEALRRKPEFRPYWNRNLKPRKDEADFRKGLDFRAEFPDPEELLVTAMEEMFRFLREADIFVPGATPIVTRKAGNLEGESFRIVVERDQITIEAGDTEGIRRGVYCLEELLAGSRAPFLKLGENRRDPWLKNRISRCFFGPIKRPPFNRDELMDEIDYYPEEYLNRLDREGRIVFSRDGVHPLLDTGHQLYFNVLRRALPELLQPQSFSVRSLPDPLDEDNLANMKLLSPDSLKIIGSPAEKLSGRSTPGRVYQNEIWKLPAGSELQLEFCGSMLLLNTLRGPDCGWVEFSVDGGKPVRVLNFTPASTVYSPANIMIPAETSGRHHLKLRVLDENVNKKTILARSRRSIVDKYPARFRETNFYLRFILAR
mgnify:CR=1 FL=1